MDATSSVVHRAIDGRRFTLTGSLDLSLPFTSAAAVNIRGRQYELTTGSAGLGDELAGAIGLRSFDEEFGFGGGTLRIGHKRDYQASTQLLEDRMLAVWQGQRYSLITQLYGTSTTAMLGALRTLRIAEHDDGIAVAPMPSAGSSFAAPASVVKQVPTLGLLELAPRSAPQASALPAWQGVATRSGELFTDTLPNGDQYFVIAGRDTWVTVLPLADTVLDRVPALVDRLDLRMIGAG